MKSKIELPGYYIHTTNCLWVSEKDYENPFWYEPLEGESEINMDIAIHKKFKEYDKHKFKKVIRMTRYRAPLKEEVFDYAQDKIREYIVKRKIVPPCELELLGLDQKREKGIKGMLKSLSEFIEVKDSLGDNPVYDSLVTLLQCGPEGVQALIRLAKNGNELRDHLHDFFHKDAKEHYLCFESIPIPRELLNSLNEGKELHSHWIFRGPYRPNPFIPRGLFRVRLNEDLSFPEEIINVVSKSEFDDLRLNLLKIERPNRNFKDRNSVYFEAEYSSNNLKVGFDRDKEYMDQYDLECLVNDLKMVSEIDIQNLKDCSEDKLIDRSFSCLDQIANHYHLRRIGRILGDVFPEVKPDNDTN